MQNYPPPNVSVRNVAQAEAPIENQSTWLINIGTHKKPINIEEEQVLRASLERALRRVLNRPEFATECFYPVVRIDGQTVQRTQPWYRTQSNLKISNIQADFVVETGTRTGRLDAHILLRVDHRDSRIQVDHRRIGSMLDEELEIENQRFVADRVYRIYTDTGHYEPVSWARPSVYTSFRSVGQSNAADAALYIRKTNDPERPVPPVETDALYKMNINFINSGPGPIGQ